MARNLIAGRFGVDESKRIITSFDHELITNKTNSSIASAYHYTNTGALNRILASGCFYSADCHYQNDPNEFLLGYKKLLHKLKSSDNIKNSRYSSKIKNMSDEISNYLICSSREITPYKNNFSSIYTISFSDAVDDLGQWDRYAGECGVAIEIDFSYLHEYGKLSICSTTDTSEETQFLELPTRPFPIAYTDSQIEALITSFIRYIEEHSKDEIPPDLLLLATINLLASHIKDVRYKHENEIRVSFFPYHAAVRNGKIFDCELVYTEDNYRFIPHVPVYCFPKSCDLSLFDNNNAKKCSGWPIKRIIVGPGRNQSEVFESLIHRMEAGIVHTLAYSEKEVMERKLDFASRAVQKYSETHLLTAEQNKTIKQLNSISVSDNGFSKVFRWQYEKYHSLSPIFIEYEKSNYCTAQGIILEKSNLKYNFKSKK